MRTALLVVGLIWALIGVGNIIIGLYNINKMGSSEGWSVFTLIFNMVLFVLPGLGVAGLGKLIKKKAVSGSGDVKKCPKCAEEVKAAAVVCRFCGYDFSPKPEVADPVATREVENL